MYSGIITGMEIETGIAPPAEKAWTPRLSSSVKSMKPGDSFLCDEKTAKTFRAYGDYHGWICRQQKQEDGGLRVWRIS